MLRIMIGPMFKSTKNVNFLVFFENRIFFAERRIFLKKIKINKREKKKFGFGDFFFRSLAFSLFNVVQFVRR